MARRLQWLCFGLALCAACELREGGSGEACTRSAQCAIGLACIEQRCSDDLSAVAEQSAVPDLSPAAPDAALDAALDASALPDGAAPLEAAVSTDDDAGS